MIKGFLGTTIIDYPGKIASIIFVSGCNFFCPFCYNKSLVIADHIKTQPDISENTILDELLKRKGFIDGIVITGGEALLWPGLRDFLSIVKKRTNLLIKLDTNGSLPKKLKSFIDDSLLDYIAMDIKTGFSKYSRLCSIKNIDKKIQESMQIIRSSGLPFEWRTTVVPPLFKISDIKEITPFLSSEDVYYFQKMAVIEEEIIDPSILEGLEDVSFTELKTMLKPILKKNVKVSYRGFD
ncbi:anaerobic ribonucleoside-triphosphate reductase activating protein [bacterium]|nr:anaerobic ribonucleoside-triphosphate reductase activating protein [bacterium]